MLFAVARSTGSPERHFVMQPTSEEVVTDIARQELRSYKQLPVNFYQIQTKFRDEIRPRFGVMRAREFLMKDAYSFHVDAASLDAEYRNMYDAYARIFTFGGDDEAAKAELEKRLLKKQSALDLVLEEAGSLQTKLGSADKALFKAKAQGRNRTAVA